MIQDKNHELNTPEGISILKEILSVLKFGNTTSPDDLLTLPEAAAFLKLSESTLNYYTDKGIIKCKRIGKHKRFLRQQLMEDVIGKGEILKRKK